MKIGFLEYQLTNSHFKKFHSLLTGAVGAGEMTIVAAGELAPTDVGRKWCADNQVRYCETMDEVIAASDALMVLAPNNPEKHLEVGGSALASGKPVYVDKFLAHTPENAEAMIALAKKAKTPLMCASALRFAVELDELDKKLKGQPVAVFARGYGKFPVYGVHTINLVLRYFGADIRRVIDTGEAAARFITIEGAGGKATMEVRDAKNGKDASPWQVGFVVDEKIEMATVKDTEGFYANLMRKAVEFFKTGTSPVGVEEQLASVQLQSASEKSFAEGGKWVDVKPAAKPAAS